MMSDNNFNQVRKILWLILLANWSVAIVKIIVGNMVSSNSMTADGYHSLTDGASNIIGLIGIYYASQPDDIDHPYGHQKFETLTGLIIAGMLFYVFVQIMYSAIDKFINPALPQITVESLVMLVVTLCVNIFVSRYEYIQGKKLNSYILISDSMHTKSDIYVSIGVLITLLGIKLGLPAIIDPLVSLVVAGFIIHAAIEIFKSSSEILVDKAAVSPEIIKEIIQKFTEIYDVHKIRSRKSNNLLFIDMHLMIDPNMNIEKSHQLVHDIETILKERLQQKIQITAHLEPFRHHNIAEDGE